jgi:hypothetical protein
MVKRSVPVDPSTDLARATRRPRWHALKDGFRVRARPHRRHRRPGRRLLRPDHGDLVGGPAIFSHVACGLLLSGTSGKRLPSGSRIATTSRTAAGPAAGGTERRGRSAPGRSAAGPRCRRTRWRSAGSGGARSAAASCQGRAQGSRPCRGYAPPATVPARKVRLCELEAQGLGPERFGPVLVFDLDDNLGHATDHDRHLSCQLPVSSLAEGLSVADKSASPAATSSETTLSSSSHPLK